MGKGIESIGLVLTSLSILIDGLELYLEGIATTSQYLKQKQELKSLLRALATENGLFVNGIERLLEGVVQEQHVTNFLADPCGERWKDEGFEMKLQDRLGSKYESYLLIIGRMSDAINILKERLKLENDSQVRGSISGFYAPRPTSLVLTCSTSLRLRKK